MYICLILVMKQSGTVGMTGVMNYYKTLKTDLVYILQGSQDGTHVQQVGKPWEEISLGATWQNSAKENPSSFKSMIWLSRRLQTNTVLSRSGLQFTVCHWITSINMYSTAIVSFHLIKLSIWPNWHNTFLWFTYNLLSMSPTPPWDGLDQSCTWFCGQCIVL